MCEKLPPRHRSRGGYFDPAVARHASDRRQTLRRARRRLPNGCFVPVRWTFYCCMLTSHLETSPAAAVARPALGNKCWAGGNARGCGARGGKCASLLPLHPRSHLSPTPDFGPFVCALSREEVPSHLTLRKWFQYTQV